MTAIPAVCALLFAILHGLDEGMDMVMRGDAMSLGETGVRSHRWFSRYHAICRAELLFCALTGFLVGLSPVHGLITLAGIFPWGWELTEIAYSEARYGRAVPASENVMGAKQVTGNTVRMVHAARILAGIALVAAYSLF